MYIEKKVQKVRCKIMGIKLLYCTKPSIKQIDHQAKAWSTF